MRLWYVCLCPEGLFLSQMFLDQITGQAPDGLELFFDSLQITKHSAKTTLFLKPSTVFHKSNIQSFSFLSIIYIFAFVTLLSIFPCWFLHLFQQPLLSCDTGAGRCLVCYLSVKKRTNNIFVGYSFLSFFFLFFLFLNYCEGNNSRIVMWPAF